MKRQQFSNIIVTLLFCCFAIHYLTDYAWNELVIIYTVLGVVGLVYAFFIFAESRRIILLILFIDLFCICGSTINCNSNWYISVGSLLPAQAGGVLLYFNSSNIKIAKKITFIMMLIVSLLVVYQLGILHTAPINIQLSKLISRNGISVLALMTLALDILYRRTKNEKISYTIYLWILLLVIIIQGRGGIISVLFLLIGMVVCESKYARSSKISMGKVFILLAFIFVAGTILSNVIEIYLGKLSTDTSRLYIWNQYIQIAQINAKSFFWGGDISNNTTLALFGNMHNEFLNIHYFYGLVPFIAYIVIFVSTIIYFCKTKEFRILFLVATLLLRSMTDATNYAFDYCWFFFLCEVILNTRRGDKSNGWQ